MNIITDIGLIILFATAGGFIAKLLKQPLISFYILAGILLGPVLGLITDVSLIEVLSEFGIAFLLFIVGIEIDLKRLKKVGWIASAGAIVQMAISFALGFGSFLLLGFSQIESIYAGVIILFSSTMVVVKILSDKSQLDTLHGRIIVGTLVVQDIVAVIVLSLLSGAGNFSVTMFAFSVFKGLALFFLAIIFSKIIFPQLFKFAARSQELFFLLSLSVCFSFALIFVSIGFSVAVGAFIAGLLLGNLPYNVEIISRVKSLKDFFATLFFVSMGLKLSFAALSEFTWPILILVFLTAVVSPLITFIMTRAFGYNKKTSFFTAIALTQISAFALIAVDQGVKIGQIGEGFLSLAIAVALITIVITSYLMKYDHQFYKFSLPFIKFIDSFFKRKKSVEVEEKLGVFDVVLIGYDRTGFHIYKTLKKMGKSILIIDYSPDVIETLRSQKKPCLYGDVADTEIFEEAHMNKVSCVVSTIPDHQDTLYLIKQVRKVNASAKLIVTAYIVEEALNFYKAGADYVILPHLLGGKHAGILLEEVSNDVDKLISTKINHIEELKAHQKNFKRHK